MDASNSMRRCPRELASLFVGVVSPRGSRAVRRSRAKSGWRHVGAARKSANRFRMAVVIARRAVLDDSRADTAQKLQAPGNRPMERTHSIAPSTYPARARLAQAE